MTGLLVQSFSFLIVTAAFQSLLFLVSHLAHTEKLVDLSASINFFMIAFIGLLWNSLYSSRQVILSIFQMIWSLRLGLFLLLRVIKRGGDSRFDKIRNDFWKFLGFWTIQILWIWLVSLPVIFVDANKKGIEKGTNMIDYIGWCLWLIGFIIESMADYQKYSNHKNKRESNNSNNDAPFVSNGGLWNYSRHPNYLGEILLWIGLCLCAFNGLRNTSTTAAVLSLSSPSCTIILLCFISGIPIAENNYLERYENDQNYLNYLENTSLLIPVPPSFYSKFPFWVKRNIFIDRWHPHDHSERKNISLAQSLSASSSSSCDKSKTE